VCASGLHAGANLVRAALERSEPELFEGG
jgi:hypothetical protein